MTAGTDRRQDFVVAQGFLAAPAEPMPGLSS
jgi:hypothetical protein